MKIQYISDLHLERKVNRVFFKKNPIQAHADYLFLLGDIIPIKDVDQITFLLDHISQVFKKVFWLPGNHEFYGSDYNQYISCNKQVRENIFLVNNQSIILGLKEVIFSTLWSNLDLNKRWSLQYHINDFKHILYNSDHINALDYNNFHLSALEFIKSRLADTTIKNKIIVTHHCPILLPILIDDALISAYCSALEDLIQMHQPDIWLYGHTHTSNDAIMINQTKLLTNQFLFGENNKIDLISWNDL